MSRTEPTTNVVVEQKPLPTALAQPFALDIAKVKGELVPVVQAVPAADPLRADAAAMAKRIVAIPQDQYDTARASVDAAGAKTMGALAHQSELLAGKLGVLMGKSQDGGPVASTLLQLRDQVKDLDPSGVDFSPGWVAHAFGSLPLVGNPIVRYFNRFETGQGVINTVIKSLENGKVVLTNDIRILSADQKAWRQNTVQLTKLIAYLQAVDEALQAELQEVTDEDHHKFLEEEVLFPLRQRIQDMQQRLLVNQQGVITSEILIRNNRELVRGVDRALFVTVDALSIAVEAALALADQKLVLDAIDALNTTTNTLIAGTAKLLKTQGAAIQKRASSTMLASDVLKQAFEDIYAAVDDITTYRREALPKMLETIKEFDGMAEKAEGAISKMERGNAVASKNLLLDVSAAA
ncbi:toxic anion resistance protein [Candidatus Kaiserbacteria bacterium]|nr:toxic anion resistance protein [Candidatus Kaiserbacteria bacterium]